jgi:solute carrier family 25 iron transporter 28/37
MAVGRGEGEGGTRGRDTMLKLTDLFFIIWLVIKQRMQLKDSVYRSVRECARTVYAKEGIAAFYISLPTTLSMSIPFQSIQFSTYERCLSLLNPDGQYDPKSHVVAGAVAGVVASSITVSRENKK